MSRLNFLPVLITVSMLAPGPVMAEVDRSPKPGGVYKLKPGVFVDKSIGCSSPPNAAIKLYDGKGISTAHTRGCVAKVISKRKSGWGFVYQVSQSCIDAGSGPGKRFTEKQTVNVPDALNFTITSKERVQYRYCPTSELPAGLRKVVPGT